MKIEFCGNIIYNDCEGGMKMNPFKINLFKNKRQNTRSNEKPEFVTLGSQLNEDKIKQDYDFFNHYFDAQLIDLYNYQKLK